MRLKTKSIRGAGTVAVTTPRRITDDSQDCCRYTTRIGRRVAIGFHRVVDRDCIRDSH